MPFAIICSAPLDNDFALLRLADPAILSANVTYACLPNGIDPFWSLTISVNNFEITNLLDVTKTYENTLLVISGWGNTASGGNSSNLLLYGFVNGMSNTVRTSIKGFFCIKTIAKKLYWIVSRIAAILDMVPASLTI